MSRTNLKQSRRLQITDWTEIFLDQIKSRFFNRGMRTAVDSNAVDRHESC